MSSDRREFFVFTSPRRNPENGQALKAICAGFRGLHAQFETSVQATHREVMGTQHTHIPDTNRHLGPREGDSVAAW
jgi:hypothetical protein